MSERTILEEFGEKSKDGDQLIAHTLQAIANMQRGGSEDVLYKAMTKEGDPRYIHKNIQGLPTDERRAWQANMLRGQIEQDPTFADTLSHKEGMERVAPQKSITSKILKALGIYQEGGKVSEKININNLISASPSESTSTWQQKDLERPDYKSDPSSILHTILGISGMIPGIGNVADLVDAGIYGLEGKGKDAALSLAAALPIAGIVAGGAKAAKKGKKALKGVSGKMPEMAETMPRTQTYQFPKTEYKTYSNTRVKKLRDRLESEDMDLFEELEIRDELRKLEPEWDEAAALADQPDTFTSSGEFTSLTSLIRGK